MSISRSILEARELLGTARKFGDSLITLRKIGLGVTITAIPRDFKHNS